MYTIKLQCINFIEPFMILMKLLNLLWKCLFYGIPDLITPFFIDSRFCLTWKNVTTHSTHSFFGSLCASYKDIQVFSGCIWIILYRLSFIWIFCVEFGFMRGGWEIIVAICWESFWDLWPRPFFVPFPPFFWCRAYAKGTKDEVKH